MKNLKSLLTAAILLSFFAPESYARYVELGDLKKNRFRITKESLKSANLMGENKHPDDPVEPDPLPPARYAFGHAKIIRTYVEEGKNPGQFEVKTEVICEKRFGIPVYKVPDGPIDDVFVDIGEVSCNGDFENSWYDFTVGGLIAYAKIDSEFKPIKKRRKHYVYYANATPQDWQMDSRYFFRTGNSSTKSLKLKHLQSRLEEPAIQGMKCGPEPIKKNPNADGSGSEMALGECEQFHKDGLTVLIDFED